MNYTIAPKLSVASVVGKIPAPGPNSPANVPIMRVVGRASSYQEKQTQYGEAICFHGDFIGTALLGVNSGKSIRSGKLYLPAVASDLVRAAIEGAGGEAIEFGFDLTISHSDKGSMGYAYGAIPLIESAAASDPVMRLASSITATLPEESPQVDFLNDAQTAPMKADGKR